MSLRRRARGPRETAAGGWTSRLASAAAWLALGLAVAPARGDAEAATALVEALPPTIRIAAGWFRRGSDEVDVRYALSLCERELGFRGREICHEPSVALLFEAEMPARRIHVRAFRIDRTEVTRAAWRTCVRAGRCPPERTPDTDERLGAPQMPVTGVTWVEARAYCEFVGGRLPTETEWERAARGVDGRRFPWGNAWNDRLANHGGLEGRAAIDGFRFLAPVGSFPDGASPFGLLDVAGNVWEWTEDRFAPGAYAGDLAVDPRGPREGGERVARGGSWRSTAEQLRVTTRRPVPEGAHAPDLGLRCAYDD